MTPESVDRLRRMATLPEEVRDDYWADLMRAQFVEAAALWALLPELVKAVDTAQETAHKAGSNQ